MATPTLDDIRDYNPWLNGENFEVPIYKRPVYQEIKEVIEKKKFIIAIIGMRRIGKTTLMKQIGNEIKGDKFFFSFEEDRFTNYDALKSVVETFIKIGNKPLIFLDEIGKIKGWAGLIKKYHDLGKARFVISGSSSLDITKGKESLAGRMIDYFLPPWQFDEYLNLKGIKAKKIGIENIEKSYLQWKEVGKEHLIDFLKKGSFPELIDINNERDIKNYIRSSTIDKIIFEDIPLTFAIENKSKLYDIMYYVGKESGSIIKTSHLGEALNISKDTVRKYLFYLHYSYLINPLPIEGSTIKSFRKPKKFYASCSPISYALSETYNESMLVETCIYDKLKNSIKKQLYFFHDSHQHEVDFTGPIVVESKWKNEITMGDLHSLLYYMKKRKLREAIVVSKTFDIREKDGIKIYILPLPFFLLCDFKDIK
jgi:predicted AAA+ superfamily ATPase